MTSSYGRPYDPRADPRAYHDDRRNGSFNSGYDTTRDNYYGAIGYSNPNGEPTGMYPVRDYRELPPPPPPPPAHTRPDPMGYNNNRYSFFFELYSSTFVLAPIECMIVIKTHHLLIAIMVVGMAECLKDLLFLQILIQIMIPIKNTIQVNRMILNIQSQLVTIHRHGSYNVSISFRFIRVFIF